jgi:hypothetical protein
MGSTSDLDAHREQAKRTTLRVSQESMWALLTGDMAADLAELRAHVAKMQTLMTAEQRMAILNDFGRLLDPESPRTNLTVTIDPAPPS